MNKVAWWWKKMQWITVKWLLSFRRCSSVVKTRVRSPALHAAACANPGQRDEDERSHEHKTTPLLTLLFTSWLELKAPPCKYSCVHSTVCMLLFFKYSVICWWYNLFPLPSLSSRPGLRWVSHWAVKWCLWRSALKAGRLLAQTGCPHHSSPCPLETSRPRRQSGIHGNSAGHSVIFLYYWYYCRFHPGDISGPIRRDLTLILIVFNLLHTVDLCE